MPEEKYTARRVALAYKAVFGKVGGGSTDQKIVWRDIESFCHAYRTAPEILSDGEMSVNNMLVNEGRRSYWLRARGQLIEAEKPEPPPLKATRARKT